MLHVGRLEPILSTNLSFHFQPIFFWTHAKYSLLCCANETQMSGCQKEERRNEFKHMRKCLAHLGGLPSRRRRPSICIWTLTRSVGLAMNWPRPPATMPPIIAFLKMEWQFSHEFAVRPTRNWHVERDCCSQRQECRTDPALIAIGERTLRLI